MYVSLIHVSPTTLLSLSLQINLQNRPKTDHTTNSTDGWYLLADGGPGRQGDVTSLISPQISATHSHCSLDFWVFCGRYSCSLQVSVGNPDVQMVKVWEADKALHGSMYFISAFLINNYVESPWFTLVHKVSHEGKVC